LFADAYLVGDRPLPVRHPSLNDVFCLKPQLSWPAYRGLFFCSLFVAGIAVVVWLRNRDILRDVFDYSIVAAAAGKVEAGYKPFTDIRSPMQSAVYLLNAAAETIFGRTYLGLSWGGLVQAVGGAWLLLWLMWRRTDFWLMMAVVLAVTLAGTLPHVVFFYNPIGIVCLSLVVLGLAIEPELRLRGTGRTWLILSACFLSGINKLNFHGVTLALAGLITVAAWLEGRIRFASVAWNALWLSLFGLVLPLVFELTWTGASMRLWLDQVVLGPTARLDYLTQILGLSMYWRPVHDFHAYILIPSIAGVGLALTVGIGLWMQMVAKPTRWIPAGRIIRVTLVVTAWLGGAAIMISNHEIVVLTSLVFPVTAVAFYLLYREHTQSSSLMPGLLIAGLACWVVTGGYAAWHGARVLYGLNPPPRDRYVRFEPTVPSLNYFAGVRMLPEQIEAMEAVGRRLQSMEGPDGRLPPLLFGQGQEWFERAYPQSIVPGAPVWLHDGTTLHASDLDYFYAITDQGQRRILVQRDWQSWPPGIQAIIERDYLPETLSGRDVLYHPKGVVPSQVAADLLRAPQPMDFRNETASAVLLPATRWSAEMKLLPGVTGPVFGATTSTNWSMPSGANELRGVAEVRVVDDAEAEGVVTLRIRRDDGVHGSLAWEMPVVVGKQQTTKVMPFNIQPGGRPLWLQILMPESLQGKVVAGWRELRIPNSNAADLSPPAPYQAGLAGGIAAKPTDWRGEFWYEKPGDVPPGWRALPAEHWRPAPATSTQVTVRVGVSPVSSGAYTNVVLVWYRAGRFEYLAERSLTPHQPQEMVLQAATPEPGGWLGVLARGHGAAIRIVAVEAGQDG